MRKSKFNNSLIMDVVKRVAAGFAVPDIWRELCISIETFSSGEPNTAALPCR